MQEISNSKLFRDNITAKINLIINNEKKAKNIEIGIFNYAIKEADKHKIIKEWYNSYFCQLYIDRFKSLYTNITNPNNPELLQLILDETIATSQLSTMTHQEFNPAKWKTLIQQKADRDKIKYETKIQAMTDTFTCKKCKKNECSYYTLQTRSADEPMTIFVTCINCDTRWRC
jgi:transcription elongation factor S-II